MDISCLVFPLAVITSEFDESRDGTHGFSQLLGELVKDGQELFALLFFANAPLVVLKLLDIWLVDLINDKIQRGDGVFWR
jgi:hypothetical protein